MSRSPRNSERSGIPSTNSDVENSPRFLEVSEFNNIMNNLLNEYVRLISIEMKQEDVDFHDDNFFIHSLRVLNEIVIKHIPYNLITNPDHFYFEFEVNINNIEFFFSMDYSEIRLFFGENGRDFHEIDMHFRNGRIVVALIDGVLDNNHIFDEYTFTYRVDLIKNFLNHTLHNLIESKIEDVNLILFRFLNEVVFPLMDSYYYNIPDFSSEIKSDDGKSSIEKNLTDIYLKVSTGMWKHNIKILYSDDIEEMEVVIVSNIKHGIPEIFYNDYKETSQMRNQYLERHILLPKELQNVTSEYLNFK